MMLTLMAATSDLESCTSDLEAVETRSSLVVLPRRWSSVETVGRCLFLLSVIFFIVGVLATVFGFSHLGLDHHQRLPLQVIGPTCLAVTVVMWAVGCLLSRLWHGELARQKHMMELRDRVQLHALAVDSLLDSPVLSPAILQDPQLRRQLLLKLKAQRPTMRSSTDSTFDTSDTQHIDSDVMARNNSSFRKHLPDDGTADVIKVSPGFSSRRSSKVAAILDARRRMSAVSQMEGADPERRESRDGAGPGSGCGRRFQLPGIQISRFETLDRSSSISSSAAAASQRSSRRYILVQSGSGTGGLQCAGGGGTSVLMGLPGGGDLARLSCPSDYSLSRSSRSRSSRASSAVSSRLWDFSPRSSEWDADISLGSRESQFSMGKQDWAGGPADCLGDDEDSSRKLSVVTFDIGSPSFRRHSSPTYPLKRRDSTTFECTCQHLAQQPYQKRYSADIRLPPPTSIMKKYSVDQSIRSLRIDEDDGDIEEEDEDAMNEGGDGEADREIKDCPSTGGSNRQSLPSSLQRLPISMGLSEVGQVGRARRDSSMSAPPTMDDRVHERRDRRRRSMRNNNTDDEEVERRVARLFREIELSLNESTDESVYHVRGAAFSDHDSQFSPRFSEAETQTINAPVEGELMQMTSDHVMIVGEKTGSMSSLDSSGSQSDYTYSNSSVGGYRPLSSATHHANDKAATVRSKWSRFAAFARALVTMRSSHQSRRVDTVWNSTPAAQPPPTPPLFTSSNNHGNSKRYLTVRKTSSVKPS